MEKNLRPQDYLLGVFPQLTHTIFNKICNKIENYSLGTPYEVCGIVSEDEVFLFENKAEDKKNFFLVDPADYMPFLESGKISFLWHSHVNCEAKPSELDMVTVREFMCDGIIYSTLSKKFCFFSHDLSKTVYF